MQTETMWRAVRMCALVGAWGVLNGFAVFILFHENTENGWTFVIGLAAAALASFVIEGLRERLKPAEHPGAAQPPSEQQRIGRFLLTLVSLATFELFITAVDHAVTLFSDSTKVVTLRDDMLGPGLLANVQSATWDLIALACLWLVAGAALSGVLATVVFLPAQKSLRERQRDGLAAGVAAGAIVAPAFVLLYIVLVRIVLALQLALFHPDQWQQHVAALAPPDQLAASTPYVGWWLLATKVIGVLFVSGITGKLETFAILAVLVFVAVRFKNWWGPLALFLVVLALAVVAPLSRDLPDLVSLPVIAALVWIVPGALLGTLAPLLENPSARTTLWTSIATAIGFAVAIVALWTKQDRSYLIGAATLIVAGVVLRRKDTLQILWPVLAIAISLTISSLTFVPLHFSATFQRLLTNVARIDALPANIAADPSGLIGDFYLVPYQVGQRYRNGGSGFVAPFYGLREKSVTERRAILTAKQHELRAGRDDLLAGIVQAERRQIAQAPALLAACRRRPGLSLSVLARTANVCLDATPAQIAALTLAGDDGLIAGGSDAALYARATADIDGIHAIMSHQAIAQTGYGYSLLKDLYFDEYGARARIRDIMHIDTDLERELAATPAHDPAPETAPPWAIVFELAIAGSVAFWITVALLAAWQMRRDDERTATT